MASIRKPTSINYQTTAPICVPDDAAPEQEPVVVQVVAVPQIVQDSGKLVQLVVGRLTSNFSCREVREEEC